jgi:hypothetical protein
VARFDRTIPPGGEGKITLEVHTKTFQGNMHKTARVTSNDPKNPQLTIGMKGKIWAPVNLNPKYARLVGTLGEEIETVVQLRGEKEEPLTLKVASVSIPDKVAVKLNEVEKGRSYQLKIRNKVDEQTRYSGQVKLTSNYPEKPGIVIRISGDIRPTVEARPKALSFDRVSEERLEQLKKNGRSMKRPLVVVLNKGNDLKIEKTELEKSLFKVLVKPVQPGRTVLLVVEPILEKVKKGPNTDRLKIYTNQKGCEVVEVSINFEISDEDEDEDMDKDEDDQ